MCHSDIDARLSESDRPAMGGARHADDEICECLLPDDISRFDDSGLEHFHSMDAGYLSGRRPRNVVPLVGDHSLVGFPSHDDARRRNLLCFLSPDDVYYHFHPSLLHLPRSNVALLSDIHLPQSLLLSPSDGELEAKHFVFSSVDLTPPAVLRLVLLHLSGLVLLFSRESLPL